MFAVTYRYPEDERAARAARTAQAAAAAGERDAQSRLAGAWAEGPRNWRYVAQGSVTIEPAEVSDNGRGLSPADLSKARSFGIRGLHERAHTVSGWVDLSSGPSGTTLILSVPLDQPPAPPAEAMPALHTDPQDPTEWGEL